MEKKHVCCDCLYSVLDRINSPQVSSDGDCWQCEQRNWQDESVCLACTYGDDHSCRGWGVKCSEFTRRDNFEA